ncbi:hypothetical protein HK098_003181 [Nowakowskiella sp. JEL0407]|nr:hypothetical protein HK098_003181 [Nowakowskiella sp. JEL0407]
MKKDQVVDTIPKRVKEIRFGVLSASDAKKLSVLEIYSKDLYNPLKPNRPPSDGGVLDPKLGVSDKRTLCKTCNLTYEHCPGHFGLIRLTLPVFHIGYFKLILKTLQNICKSCSRILIPEERRRIYLKKLRRKELDDIQKKIIQKDLNAECKKCSVCPFCFELQGPVKKVGALKIVHEKFRKKIDGDAATAFRKTFDDMVKLDSTIKPHIMKAQQDLNPLVVKYLFERINYEDAEIMGFSAEFRPEMFIWESLVVPPKGLRPSVGIQDSTNEDDLTVLLSDIVYINMELEKFLEEGREGFLDYWDWLQVSCGMYVNSDLPGVASHLLGNVRKIKKGFCQRLKGKHGRFRGNLSGKRVDFSGRTVISPDPNLRIDQVAIPLRMAQILTYPCIVTPSNITYLRSCVKNGPSQFPGAVYLQKQNEPRKRYLKYGNEKLSQELAVGDLVERHLNDDDVVLFNRQPSLHKLSIMAHRVKVRPWRTLRFNECVCTPYNADFDGDEMNVHVPQTEEAKAEAVILMGVKNNLVTPRNGEPLIAATQDFITASYLISKKDNFYDRSQFVHICTYMSDALEEVEIPPPVIWKPVQLWTGKQIISILLRPNSKSKTMLNLETKCRNQIKMPGLNRAGVEYDKCMDLFDGHLVIRNSQLLCGCIDKSIIGDGNKNSMFYTAMRDYGPDEAARCMNRIAKLSARWLANQGFSIGIDDVQPGEELRKAKEIMINSGYDTCDELIETYKMGKLATDPGSNEEQTLENKVSGVLSRIREDLYQVCAKELSIYNAPLNMSLCGSKGSKINVSQMIACVGQQILNGKRVPNGFGDRSLPHFPKYSKFPAAKGFVRNSFYTGLQPPEFFFHAMSGREGLVDTAVKTAETGYMQRRLMKALEDLGAQYDYSVRNSFGGVIQFTYGDDALDPANMEGDQKPVEFSRNLEHCQALFENSNDTPLLPHEMIEFVKKQITMPRFRFCSESFLNSLTDFIKAKAEKLGEVRKKLGLDPMTDKPIKMKGLSFDDSDDDESKLSPKLVYTKQQLTKFLDICLTKFSRAKIEPGTAVGAIGAQSIGEPGTQMTLKTFHFAGVASMNVTLGVPRIKEIINAAKKISTPIIEARLNKGVDRNEKSARVVKARIEKTLLEHVAKYFQEIVSIDECALLVKIDLDSLRKLQLEVNLHTIKHSIVMAPKLKISDSRVNVILPDLIKVRVDVKDERHAFYALQALKRSLPGIIIAGIPTVNRAVISKEKNKKTGDQEYKLLVEGSGLREVMGIPGVEGIHCRSNNTLEMFKVLGIEAARNTICHEIVYTMSSHGMTIDRRHVMLLADLMTFKGEVLGITRFGIAKMKDSVMMLASFEKTTDHLFDASFYSKRDSIMGVTECIIMGIPMTIGTGLFKLLQKTDRNIDTIGKGREMLLNMALLSTTSETTWLRVVILSLVSILAFSTRLFSVIRFESVIHEFDPWFNYRTTINLVDNGFYDFLNWFDQLSWYPLGRVVGGTVYPGIMVTAGIIHYILNKLHFPIDIREVCVFLAPLFSGFTAIACYLLTSEMKDPSAGLLAAAFIGVAPGYISRSVAGSYDNEGIAIFLLMFTFYLWIKAVKLGSAFYGGLTAMFYFYMVSAWGGYVFIINLIPLHVFVLILMGRYTPKIYVAYSSFYVLGTLSSMNIPFVNFLPTRTNDHMAALGIFGLIQIVAFIDLLRSHLSSGQFKLVFSTLIAGFFIVGLAALVGLTMGGYIAPWTGRFYSLWDTNYAKKYIPIIASVSEHQPTAWPSFFFDMQFLIPIFPAGIYFCFKELRDEHVFVILYAITASYFAGVMVRLILTLTPIVCVASAIAVSHLLDVYVKTIPEEEEKPKKRSGSMSSDEELPKSNEWFGISDPFSRRVMLPLIFLILLLFQFHCTWVTSNAYSSPSIILASRGADGSQIIIDDFREAYYWLRQNTKPDAKILSWWDYGYQITGMANRTVLVDNNTWNNTHIATVGKAMASSEDVSYEIMRRHDVDYVLVIFGAGIGYSGDDINKFLWMVRIGEGVYPDDLKERDFFTARGEYRMDDAAPATMRNSLMYKMSYYRFAEMFGGQQPYDRVRGTPVSSKPIKLSVLDEAYTTENMIVRIYAVKPPDNIGRSMSAAAKVTAWFFRAGKAFATEDGKGIYQGSMEKALEKLNQNDWVHVFPEAKIVQDGTIHPFRWGIGRLIMESKTPPIVVPFFHKIVMIFAKGMERIMPTYTLLRPRPLQKLFFMVGEPIDFAEHHHLWEDLKKDFERQKELHRTFEDYDAQKVRIQIVQMLKDKLESLRSEGLKMIENQK